MGERCNIFVLCIDLLMLDSKNIVGNFVTQLEVYIPFFHSIVINIHRAKSNSDSFRSKQFFTLHRFCCGYITMSVYCKQTNKT
jgi:hypothetical protein